MNAIARVAAGVVLLCGCGAEPGGTTAFDTNDEMDVSKEELVSGLADWAQSGRTPRRTGYNPLESTINSANVADLSVAWTQSAVTAPVALALWRGMLFVTNTAALPSPGLSAFDPCTGSTLWSTPLLVDDFENGFSSGIAVGYGTIHAQENNGAVDISTTTGEKLRQGGLGAGWDNHISPPLVKGRRVVAETHDSYFADVGETVPGIWAINADTGKRVWSKSLAAFPQQELQFPRTPALANDRIFSVNGNNLFVSGDNALVALSADTGATLWKSAPAIGILGSPSVLHGQVFIMSQPNVLMAYDERTGNSLWSAAHTGAYPTREPMPAPALDEQSAYVALNASPSGVVVGAFDAATGAKRWSVVVGSSARGRRGPLAVANGLVYVGTEGGSLHALDVESGAERASYQFGSAIHDLVVANGRLHVATFRNGVLTLAASDGRCD